MRVVSSGATSSARRKAGAADGKIEGPLAPACESSRPTPNEALRNMAADSVT